VDFTFKNASANAFDVGEVRGGIPIVEITMTVPGVLEVLSHLLSGK
jgi:2-keto-3-deoxy-6-phosphogluconate aldolase